jgi:hypothetical protein
MNKPTSSFRQGFLASKGEYRTGGPVELSDGQKMDRVTISGSKQVSASESS